MEITRLRPECITCILKKHMGHFPEGTSDEQKIIYMQELCRIVADAKPTDSAPILVNAIDELQERILGSKRDYTEIKTYFNQLMRTYEDNLWSNIEQSEDSLKLAIQYAMMGNFIDFGAMDSVDESKLDNLLNEACNNPIPADEYSNLRRDLSQGKRLVYITDNCGEIVLDKLLVRAIQEIYPQLDITVMVRGGDVLNDATMTDAVQSGMTELVPVIHNGNAIAGTVYELLSREANRMMDEAEVLIAKGQANFETMRMSGKNIYYIFLCKCEMFARNFNVPQYTGMLVNDRRL